MDRPRRMLDMRSSVFVGAFIGLLLAAPAVFGQAQRALLSVDGLSIPANGALASFHIDTWGVIPLAVCHVPPLWELREEKFMDSAAVLSGREDPYHRSLSKLDKLFLVDVYSLYPKAIQKGSTTLHRSPAGLRCLTEMAMS